MTNAADCASSFIQTVLSVSESHRINAYALADFCLSIHRRWGLAPRPEDTVQFFIRIPCYGILVKVSNLC